jgi:hypothetical protein
MRSSQVNALNIFFMSSSYDATLMLYQDMFDFDYI